MFNFNPNICYNCAWCNSIRTTIVSNNKPSILPINPPILDEDYNFKSFKKNKWENDFYFPPLPSILIPPSPNTFPNKSTDIVIRCNDCNKTSLVKSLNCKLCFKNEIVIVKISSGLLTDYYGENYARPINNHVCNECKFKSTLQICKHSWVGTSGELFSEGLSKNLICTKCGRKRVTYPQNSTNPFDDNGMYR